MGDADSKECLCRSENVRAYFEGELDPTMGFILAQHIGECGECAEYLLTLQRLRNLVSLALRDNYSFVIKRSGRAASK
jgi:anti-sigma factor RsiW